MGRDSTPDDSPLDGSPPSTFGREGDLSLIQAFIDHAARSGGALLLTGDAGVGKTVLLAEAARYADLRIVADTTSARYTAAAGMSVALRASLVRG